MKVKECLNCHQPNPANALVCIHCDTPFTTTGATRTVNIPEGMGTVSRLEHVEHLMRLHPGGLVLLAAHTNQPMVVAPGVTQITIGRHAPPEPAPTINLDPYGAAKLGISRSHARIMRSSTGCTVEDLLSKNGSWLNGARIEPQVAHVLRSGDELRLGHLTLHVYFEMPNPVSRTVFFINTLHDTGTVTRHRLSAHELAVGLAPFLRAMGDGQNLLDTLHGITPSDIGIHKLSTDPQSRTISVSLDGASAIIGLLKTQILPWKKANSTLIEARDDALQQALKALTLNLLRQVRPELDETRQKQVAQQFLPIVQTFIFSSFEMMTEQPVIEA